MTRGKEKLPEHPPGVQSAVDCADAVIAGTVDAGHLVHLACERFNRDWNDGTWEFRPELADWQWILPGRCQTSKGSRPVKCGA
jgi:hypothetical protein